MALKKVEVTFTNRAGVEETATGIVINAYMDGDGYAVFDIVLPENRIVECKESWWGEWSDVGPTFVERVDSNINTNEHPKSNWKNLKLIEGEDNGTGSKTQQR